MKFQIHWSPTRQGFVFYNTRIHYFIQKEFWKEKERPEWARDDCLISLCKLNQIQNDQPIIYPSLDDQLICQRWNRGAGVYLQLDYRDLRLAGRREHCKHASLHLCTSAEAGEFQCICYANTLCNRG